MRWKKAHRRRWETLDQRQLKRAKAYFRKYYAAWPMMTNEQIRNGDMPEEVFGWDYLERQAMHDMERMRRMPDLPPALRKLFDIYDLVQTPAQTPDEYRMGQMLRMLL